MILATFDQDGSHNIIGYEIKGHSGYADSGEDIICAAVSVLAINTANAIEKLLHRNVEAVQEDGYLKCSFSDPQDEKVQLLLNTLILGIEDIRDSYGDRFLKVRFR